MNGEVRLWPWELARLNIRQWGLPTGMTLWRCWRTERPVGSGNWTASQILPHPNPELVAIRTLRVVLRSGPRYRE